MRPNRVQKQVCRLAVAEALGEAEAEVILRETGIGDLPDLLPAGPRDLDALFAELRPFADLYRAVLVRAGREMALAVARRAIVHSGLIGHAHDAAARRLGPGGAPRAAQGLSLTSPPPPGFAADPDEVQRQFEAAMRFFSCEGRLLAYTPAYVRFHVTGCNWCRAMERAGVPELIPFFCETDERFMDGHPTHRLLRPTAIGLGDAHCDFQFVPKATGDTTHREGCTS
ncbi:MAG: L-2-amino-thiazoline-4-carboxylic acid hydrolase [Armatimonadota bacterium]|nr:L-2-amino-thiazoline-4-carboxylic acid hydrolase [Armatimonadota bacterium]MDR7550346.1 L-2-amino-thiazoline-4-carboxylic acid hydrolase [Armatimonadota bacterium]